MIRPAAPKPPPDLPPPFNKRLIKRALLAFAGFARAPPSKGFKYLGNRDLLAGNLGDILRKVARG